MAHGTQCCMWIAVCGRPHIMQAPGRHFFSWLSCCVAYGKPKPHYCVCVIGARTWLVPLCSCSLPWIVVNNALASWLLSSWSRCSVRGAGCCYFCTAQPGQWWQPQLVECDVTTTVQVSANCDVWTWIIETVNLENRKKQLFWPTSRLIDSPPPAAVCRNCW